MYGAKVVVPRVGTFGLTLSDAGDEAVRLGEVRLGARGKSVVCRGSSSPLIALIRAIVLEVGGIETIKTFTGRLWSCQACRFKSLTSKLACPENVRLRHCGAIDAPGVGLVW